MNALLAIVNTFIDPAETVRRIEGRKLAWLLPVLIGGICMGLYIYNLTPFNIQAMQADPPPGVDPAQINNMVQGMRTGTRFIAMLAPVMFAVVVLLGSAAIAVACLVLTIPVKFPDLFSLVSHVSLINILGTGAHYLVLRSKGEISSMKELQPSFGLEMFLPETAPKMLHAFFAFFSVFTVWHIVMLGIGFAALARIPKAKAFLATAPSWMIGLLFALIGSLFR